MKKIFNRMLRGRDGLNNRCRKSENIGSSKMGNLVYEKNRLMDIKLGIIVVVVIYSALLI